VQNAKKLAPKKASLQKPKAVTARDLYAAQAMGALISNSNGFVDRDQIKRDALAWADFMLED
jgi:hypothetical protein